MRKKAGVLILCLGMMWILTGCISSIGNEKKIRDVDYTVLNKEELPEELTTLLQEEQGKEMRFFYANEGYTYIVIGYGPQKTSGYSIRIDKLYETESELIVGSTLIGPRSDEEKKKVETYPYVVLKIEETDKNLVFE